MGQGRGCSEAGGCPCPGRLSGENESDGCAEDCCCEPERCAAVSREEHIDASPRKHSDRERGHPHELLWVSERGPEWHHAVEDFVKAAQLSEGKEECKKADQGQETQVTAPPRSKKRQPCHGNPYVETLSPVAPRPHGVAEKETPHGWE